LYKGFSLGDLEKALFGSHAQEEEPHYPQLSVCTSKVSYKFGWLPKKIKLAIYDVARLSPTDWHIKAQVRAVKDGDGLFEFEGEYSTHKRIGAGIIYASWIATRTDYYDLGEIEGYYGQLTALKSGQDVRDILRVAYMLWDRCMITPTDVESLQRTVKMIKGLAAMTSDYRVRYLAQALLKKLE